MDLSHWIERHAGFTPGKVAVRSGSTVLSYRAFDRRIRALARGLKHDLGLGRGDRVAFLGPNHVDFLTLLFACARLGLIMVPLNWRLAVPEHAYVLRHSGAEILVVTEHFAEIAGTLAGELADLRPLALGFEREGFRPFEDLLQGEGDDRNPHVDLESPLLLVYTSGTTGRPKGAVLRQEALFWNALNSLHMHDLTSRDHVLTVLPLFHVGGLNIQTTPALYAGAEVTLLERFDAGVVLETVRSLRPSLTVLVPATMQALIEHPDWSGTELSSLRMIACGSQIVPRPLLDAFQERGIPAAQVYGSTETSPIAIYQRAEDALRKPGSTGRPALHVEVRVVDEHGEDAAPGEPGEILVRGGNVMFEYWGDEPATRGALREGWFHTGDIAQIDGEGDFWVVDRKKNVVISGGENIYPAEVEALLHAHPGIREAVVIGLADDRWGEVPVAVIVPADRRLSEADVLGLLEGRLARFKHPRRVVFMDDLPRNAMGKVLRYRLRDWIEVRERRARPG